MSITRLPRELGLIVRCDAEGCETKYHTGNISTKNTRGWLKNREGWGRGLRKKSTETLQANRRSDFCPPHMLIERELAAQEKAATEERKRIRNENRKAKFAPKPPKEPKPKKPRKSKSVPTSASSPSADSHPAPAT